MSRPIGYYVHHHGDGHRRRALAIAHAAPGRLTLIGTGLAGRTKGVDCLDLPDDRLTDSDFDGIDAAGDRPLALHYAPIDHEGVRSRVALVADWIQRARPQLLVVDVSVEIAMLARLAATPTVYVRLCGSRVDMAHIEAFRGARALMAPFHRDLDEAAGVDWIGAKTRYCPGLTTLAPRDWRADTILVVHGKGGAAGSGDELALAARALPAFQLRVIGPVSPPAHRPDNLTLLGWVEDAETEIAAAGLVIGAAGDGLVTAVIAAGRPFICLPQPRPFDEQGSKARRLAATGAAIVLETWPSPGDWAALMSAARALDPDALRHLHDPHGPRRAARFLIETAEKGTHDAAE